jgi:hypothetical protein
MGYAGASAVKRKPRPLVLYSTNTWLSHAICERFYQGVHYVWCTPHAKPASVPSHDATVPPSSSPLEIYRLLSHEVARGDRHSAFIQQNRAGILRGAQSRRQQGAIGERQEAEIRAVVSLAEIRDFKPLLFVIPFAKVRGMIREVPVEQRAHPLSLEYIIESLPRPSFDIIEFPA